MRYIHAILIILAGFLILPSLTWSQGPGGKGPNGRGMDPDARFNQLSGGKEYIVISELDQSTQGRLLQFGLTGERVTREQYKEAIAKMTQMFQSKFAAPSGGPPAAAPTGAPMTVQVGAPPMGGGPGGPRGPGGPPPSADDLNRRAEGSFNRHDKNKDGLLDTSELADPQLEELLRDKDSFDTNHDGFIDLNEYKAYTAARDAQRRAARAEQEGNKTDPSDPDHPATTPEDGRPMVFRAGRLPKDLPEWFVRLDKLGDNDGQVGLDEWVRGKQGPLDEFQKMDLNGDGLLTAEEFLRWKAIETKKHGGDQVASRGNNRGGNQGPQQAQAVPGGFQMPAGGPGGFQMPAGGPGGFQMPAGGPGGFQRPSGGPGGFQRPSGGPGGFQRPGGDNAAADPNAESGAGRMRKGGGGGTDQGGNTGGQPRGKKNRDNGN